MKTIGLVLARMGSSRLPGKSLGLVDGKPLVVRIIERMQSSGLFDEVVLASPSSSQNQPLLEAGAGVGAIPFAGSEEDVLDRFYQAAKSVDADAIVHIGGDCPFPDHEIMGKALNMLVREKLDFVSNLEQLTFPAGMDTDAISFEALEVMARNATLKTHRTHCLSYIHHFPSQFKIKSFKCDEPLGDLRWTVDYPEDLEFVRKVYETLGQNDAYFSMADILSFVREHPEVAKINDNLSTFVDDQPAYWDSEGYMTDFREDTQLVIERALKLDSQGVYDQAYESYSLAEQFVGELASRARLLNKSTKDRV